MTSLGDRIHVTREARHLTIEGLAAAAHVQAATIRRLEANEPRFRPHNQTIRHVADALAVDPHWLLRGYRPAFPARTESARP